MKKFKEIFPNYEIEFNYSLNEKILRAVSYRITELIRERVRNSPGRLNPDGLFKRISEIISVHTNNEKTKNWGWDFIKADFERQILDFQLLKLHKFMDAISEITILLIDSTRVISDLNDIFEDFEFPFKLTGDKEITWGIISIQSPKSLNLCVLCHSNVELTSTNEDKNRDIKSFSCPLCGNYKVSEEAYNELKLEFSSKYAKISAYTRGRTIQNLPTPLIVLEENFLEVEKDDVASIEKILNSFPTSIELRGLNTLKNLSSLSEYTGYEIRVDGSDYPIFFIESNQNPSQQVKFVIDYLIDKGYLKTAYTELPAYISITPLGWDILREFRNENKPSTLEIIENKSEGVIKMKTKTNPAVFIGSSSEHLNVAYALQSRLESCSEPTVWDQGIFKLSKTTMDSLIAALNNFDFAVFVFGPDDITEIRDEKKNVVRDNVIFELGLFIGKIGLERTFFVVPTGVENLHLPSDLAGITYGRYNDKREDGNLQAALGPVANEIKTFITQLGLIR
jgi:predicted nucleotide-binding protein/predicted oxidoreductase (fatty acid repression mutant protein)